MSDKTEEINLKIQSLRELKNIEYKKPENKTSEYQKRLFKNKEVLTYLIRDRGLKLETIKHFKLGLTEKNLIAIPIYKNNELINYKFRTIPPSEKLFTQVKGCETWVFNDEGIKEGKEKKEIIICEGQFDLLSLWQNGFTNVISLNAGTQSIGSWIEELDEIETLYINLDSDDAGKEGAKKLAERLGIEKCINVTLPEKDPNDFFKKYSAEDYKNVLLNSTKFPIQDVINISELFDEIKKNPTFVHDFQFPFSSLQNLTGGFSRGQVITISAPSNHGKSVWTWNVLTGIAKKKLPILYVPLEDRIRYFGRNIFNILANEPVWKFTEEQWEALRMKVLDFPFFIYTGLEDFNLDVFKNLVEKGRKLYGIEIFAIDYLDFLITGRKSEHEEISDIMKKLALIAREYDITIFLLVQIRKKKDGDEGWNKIPSIESLGGSAKIRQVSHMCLMLFQDFKNGGTSSLLVQVQKNREGKKHNSRDDFFTWGVDFETSIMNDNFYE